MSNRTHEAYEKWASSYDIHPNPHITLEHKYVLKAMDAKSGEKILDAACGTGKYIIEFFNSGANVIGIDFSGKMIESAHSKFPKLKLIQTDLRKKLPFKSSQFDKINCAQALKHIFKLKFTLKEFYRILKKEGFLVFSVTHPEMDWTGYETKYNPKFNQCPLQDSDIFHHKFADYFKAFNQTNFKIYDIIQIPVDNTIKHLLTNRSYRKVKGRYQIIIFKLIKRNSNL